jgi:hypothetical protein
MGMARVIFCASGSEALETAAKIVRCFWAANDHAALILRDLGVSVEHMVQPWGPEVMEAALTHLRMMFGTSSAPEPPADRECMKPFARQFADAGLRVTVPFNILSTRLALLAGGEWRARGVADRRPSV